MPGQKNCPAGGGPPVAVRPGITGRRWSIPVPFASVIGRRFGWSPGFGVPAGTPLHRHRSDTESCVLFLFLFLSLFQSFLLFPLPLLKQEGGRYVVSYHIHRHMIRFLNCNDGDGRVLHTVVLLQPSGFQIQLAFNVACHFFSFGKVVQVT